MYMTVSGPVTKYRSCAILLVPSPLALSQFFVLCLLPLHFSLLTQQTRDSPTDIPSCDHIHADVNHRLLTFIRGRSHLTTCKTCRPTAIEL